MSSKHLSKRLHGRKTPPGIELAILRRMPALFLLFTLSIASLSAAARLFPANDSLAAFSKHVASVDIFVIATIATVWTLLLTLTIGCVLVYVMKGPAYVADAYTPDEPRTPAGDSLPD